MTNQPETPQQFPEDQAYPLDQGDPILRGGDTVPVDQQSPPALIFSHGTYEILRTFVEVLLPGLSTLYVALAAIWGLPGEDEVSQTVAAFTVFLGLIVRLARRTYNKSDEKFDGAVQFQDFPEERRVDMNLAFGNVDPKTLLDKKEITLKVHPPIS